MNIKVLVIGLICFPISAFAYCSEPDQPYSNPSPPYCYDNVCESWEVDSYRDDVERNMRKWNSYAEEAIDYAKCKRNELVEEWNEFVSYNRVRN